MTVPARSTINGAVARLKEIQTFGKITGKEWPDIWRWSKHLPLHSNP
ncbi:hypothetical protein [Nocardia sp. NPDC051463]